MLPSVWIVVLLHFPVGLGLYVIPKQEIRESEGPRRLIAFFQRWTPWTDVDNPEGTYLLQGQAPRFPYGMLWIIYSSPGWPHYDWVEYRW